MAIGVLQDQGNNPYPVAATGFLLGSQVTLVLYGLHLAQVARYYGRFGSSDKKKYHHLLVPAVFLLSTTHIFLIVISIHHYFVTGIEERYIWSTFYAGLSGQDFVIPIISFVSHIFFGYRIYNLKRFKRAWWVAFVIFASLTCAVGIAFAVLARLWSLHPFESKTAFDALPYGRAADTLPTAWLSCAACIDGGLTASLLYILLRERYFYNRTRRLLYKIVGLTLETVLLTHVIGAVLFVLWLTSRTRTDAFWFLIEIISETYALSILFTLNARASLRKVAHPEPHHMIDRQLNRLREMEEARVAPEVYPPGANTASDETSSRSEGLPTVSSSDGVWAIALPPMRRNRDNVDGASTPQSNSTSPGTKSYTHEASDSQHYLPVLDAIGSGRQDSADSISSSPTPNKA